MRITNESMYLIDKICTNITMPPLRLTSHTYDVIFHLVNQIIQADKTFATIGRKYVYNINVIDSTANVPKPNLFKSSDFPKEIMTHINSHMKVDIGYSLRLNDMNVFIHFIVEESSIHIEEFNRYVDLIIVWLIMLNTYSGDEIDAKTLYLYFYFTSLPKQIPKVGETLDKIHVNTGMTFTHNSNPMEIVIFRREEWFKVFIHESFHNLGMDFSKYANL